MLVPSILVASGTAGALRPLVVHAGIILAGGWLSIARALTVL